jgi:hypothetical protein
MFDLSIAGSIAAIMAGIASHRIALHRIASHRIASQRQTNNGKFTWSKMFRGFLGCTKPQAVKGHRTCKSK